MSMISNNSRSGARRELLDSLKLQLMGPELKEDCTEDKPIRVEDSIRDHFPVGVLYPLQEEEADQSEDDALAQIHVEDAKGGPQAMGLSFLIRSESSPKVSVQIEAGRFEKKGEDDNFWTKEVLANEDSPFMDFQKPAGSKVDKRVLSDRAEIHVRWRKEAETLWHITVALSNVQVMESLGDRTEKSLFRTKIRCRALDGEIEHFGLNDSGLQTDESQEWAVIYRDRKAYACGHNTSADWSECPDTGVVEVRTEFIPEAVIPELTFELEGECEEATRALDMNFLAGGERSEIHECLGKFIAQHEKWIDSSTHEISTICRDLENSIPEVETVCQRIIDRHRQISVRMNRSRDLISGDLYDEDVLKAFQLANQAMFDQLTQSMSLKGIEGGSSPKWRPFQLAFQLLILQDLIDPTSEDSYRDTVDLLWFPTGGGKTEAYLGIAAFEIFRRRLQEGDKGAGVAVIKRYTLRALTFQQFERAGRMIAASELIRKQDPDLEDGPPITIGLWVGQSISPNTTSRDSEDASQGGALQIFEQCEIGAMPFPSSLRRCCWCGQELRKKSVDQCEAIGKTLKIRCSNSDCEFGGASSLPVEFVDESLYENPPSLLIGVIDKFAQLPLNPKTREILGSRFMPPSVIIQDELHLIDGDLGSLAGGYEAAIDVICSRKGIRPKVIGATATISGAADQCRALYGRDQQTFPPPGLNIEDSFFMRVKKDAPGRLYAGVMGTGASPTYTAVVTNSALIHGANQIAEKRKSEYDWEVLDGYLSLVTYHNTLRELSNTLTASMDHLPRNLELMGFSRGLNTLELSSRTDSKEIASTMSSISKFTKEGEPPEIDQLACSSIFGVGVDISRLGLMSVMGQPKSTSDYIQATSRVGRGESPGLVITLLNYRRSRDRSHYESFKKYHESIYRHVEPTSVTPFSLGARNRSMAPAFVAVCRHGSADLGEETGASMIHRPEYADRLEEFRDKFLQRCKEADPNEAMSLEEDLDQFLNEWTALSRNGNEEKLRYYSPKKELHSSELFVLVNRAEFFKRMKKDPAGFQKVLRVAPTSLRHVDTEISIRSKEARL
ncbi:helicase-related protein [Planctomycetota bacterium]|nr:helicase-related protein [Planctomycetota bacterium]